MKHAAEIRLDKWLWAARFFKTRALASKAIQGGKVRCNGKRIKPARPVHQDDTLEIQQGHERKTVQVQKLPSRRGPAAEAAKLYQETEASLLLREQNAEQRRALTASRPHGHGRPAKRERRHIIRFTRSSE